MNEIAFACPSCSRTLKVPPQYAGMESDCPGCGKGLRIPTREELIAANIAGRNHRDVPQTQVVEHPAPAAPANDDEDSEHEKNEQPARDYQQREQTGKAEAETAGRNAARDRKRATSNASADMAAALNALNKHEAAYVAAQKAKSAKDADKKTISEPSPLDAVDAVERCIINRDLGAAEVVSRALSSGDHRIVRAGSCAAARRTSPS
jgi:hypothetical protein